MGLATVERCRSLTPKPQAGDQNLSQNLTLPKPDPALASNHWEKTLDMIYCGATREGWLVVMQPSGA